jgi:hypothetical protein
MGVPFRVFSVNETGNKWMKLEEVVKVSLTCQADSFTFKLAGLTFPKKDVYLRPSVF